MCVCARVFVYCLQEVTLEGKHVRFIEFNDFAFGIACSHEYIALVRHAHSSIHSDRIVLLDYETGTLAAAHDTHTD